jgi:predicted dehydrogenase
MNRRDFTQLLALALPASRLPLSAQTPAPQKPVNYAVIGLGGISDIFMRACAQSQHSKVVALVTGHPEEKGSKYAEMYNIPKSSIYTYETFDQVKNNPDIDAVYIGLPNSMHKEYTLRAAAAGKHVLCEKPMAISSAECRTMIDACKAANVKLMIAYRIQYEPLWLQVQQILEQGAIGEIQSFQGGFFNSQPAGAWRLSKTLGGGGSVLDLGIYPLNAIRWLTKEEPSSYTAITATRDHSGRFNEVEQSVEWTMKMPSGIIASCGCSYGSSGPGFLNICGDKGSLQFNPGFNYDGLHLIGGGDHKRIDIASTGKSPYQFTIEADHFSDCVRNNRTPKTPGEEGLKDMLAIEAIYQAAGAPIA